MQQTKIHKNLFQVFVLSLIVITFTFVALVTRPIMDASSIDYSLYTSKSVSFDNGNQIISMKANAGYSPNKILAKAGVPTELEVETANTFDCTSIMNIPSLNIKQSLPSTGITKFTIPSQTVGSIVTGYCGAETYRFEILFS